jgi:hypothetical protein
MMAACATAWSNAGGILPTVPICRASTRSPTRPNLGGILLKLPCADLIVVCTNLEKEMIMANENRGGAGSMNFEDMSDDQLRDYIGGKIDMGVSRADLIIMAVQADENRRGQSR